MNLKLWNKVDVIDVFTGIKLWSNKIGLLETAFCNFRPGYTTGKHLPERMFLAPTIKRTKN